VKYYFIALSGLVTVLLGLTGLLLWYDEATRARARDACQSAGLETQILWGKATCVDPATGAIADEPGEASAAAHSPYGNLNREQLRRHMEANPMRSIDHLVDPS